MSAYWCADSADGKAIIDGYCGEWPLKPEAVAEFGKGYDSFDDRALRFLLAGEIYRALRKLRPDGGEIPWSEVPEWIKAASDFAETPAKLCVSF